MQSPNSGHICPPDPYARLRANMLVARNLSSLRKALGWSRPPVLSGHPYLYAFDYLEDLNERRLRDAETIASACRNEVAKVMLEIGTSHGRTTALMAQNAPRGIVYTVNIHPEEITTGGNLVTFAPSLSDIGSYYRARRLRNIRQIIANTLTWEPDIGEIDIAFIDGCHDAEFVYSDTRKVLQHMRPGSIIMWHDFCLSLVHVYDWIGQVCLGVERLYEEGFLCGRILQLQDSWVGLYRVPGRPEVSRQATTEVPTRESS